ncbi:MAG TPA: bifunctional phosphopantothenoylcysteine decarboxylase/phosphopantothenate--cysteine ligase CoaBC [Candidatus Protoclostridium stercorigallinarum]|uniref:Coenzyme A biosynthesis bifunctional protein CoaBC n=1 Tax=Candidatus Protoclostridium stercorigallinarum TaxID=2838741 RepID=A0A9D1Q0L6_9FIRM|nr:bifunctional phosphopantothenoylcysteine decarboxylase/phosphopantothenate--cysteine ligase CoaBC [Candidatus Protoclostridium stercorigallinarum]
MDLKGKCVLVGVTGGIAVYKVCTLVSSLKKRGADVRVAMTKNATEFVSPLTFETLSGNRTVVDTFDRDHEWEVEHISLAKRADVCVIAPCTADFAGKLACGIADDFLSTTVMACTCPVLLAPAMNTNMLASAAYRANKKILEERGVRFVPTGSGLLACGDNGDGRMAEPDVIERYVVDLLYPRRDLAGKTVLVTAGGTREPIDPVRYICNRSSGKMGAAIAKAAADRGADVIVVCGSVTADLSDSRFERHDVVTTKDMYDAVMKELPRADVIIKAAAPCDFRPKRSADKKIKAGSDLTLELERTEDIAAAVGRAKGEKILVIFAAETGNAESYAKDKLKKKNADMVVANDVSLAGAGFGTDTNIATIITRDKTEELPLMTKRELADIILDRIAEIK